MVESKSDQQIGYILRSYPRLSQTFVLNEILALEQIGVPIQIFAITNPQEQIVQPQVGQVKARVRYLNAKERWKDRPALADRRRTVLALGSRYLRALRYVVQNSQIDQGYTAASRMDCFYQAFHLVQILDEERQKTGRTIRHLHAHFAHDPALIAQLVNMMMGIPFSFTAHARDLYQVPAPVLLDRINQASRVVTCCKTNLDYLHHIAPHAQAKCSLIYHGVNLNGFQPPAVPVKNREIPLILSVGRLVEKKGFLDLLQVLLRVKEKEGRFRCEIYGDGPLRPEITRWIQEHGLTDEVMMAGTCTQEQLIPVYQRAALYILTPTVTEDGDRDGIPNSLAEAMAVGLPVISTNVAGIPELVKHNRNGLLYQPHDIEGFASGILDLLSNEKKRRVLGRAARRQVTEQFDIATAALKLKTLFTQVLTSEVAKVTDLASLKPVVLTKDQ